MNRDRSINRIPYTGLRPFESYEADLFFGREDQIESMLSALEKNRFLAVVGASGCGKSSLVRAGLLPALADGFLMSAGDRWRFVIARPGDDPFANLASAIVSAMDSSSLKQSPTKRLAVSRANIDEYQLALVEKALLSSRTGLADALAQCDIEPTQPVLVMIDQFEELFRFREQARREHSTDLYQTRNHATAFVELLLQSVQQKQQAIYLVITMRSDFMGDCDAFAALPEAISRSQFLTPRMQRAQLAEAIAGPLDACGYSVEPGFVNRVLNDVGNDPDQLPLMQHALLRTWNHLEQIRGEEQNPEVGSASLGGTKVDYGLMRLKDYEHVGGVNGALDQHADWVFNSLCDDAAAAKSLNSDVRDGRSSALQIAAQRLFCCLSDQPEGSPLTRRPVTVEQAVLETGGSQADIEAVANAFQAANLIVFSPPDQPLGATTRLDISHESLLRQWKRLQSWIEGENQSTLQYRRLLDALRTGEQLLSETHLNQAEEWLAAARPTVHWAMRHDGATDESHSQFLACRNLIEQSREAIRLRLEKEQASAEREKQLLKEKAEEAEASARRFRARTQLALAACFFAIAFLIYALLNLRQANIATADAKKNEAAAEIARQQADDNRDRAEELQANALRENADHYWRYATIARSAGLAVKASHLYLRAAQSSDAISTKWKLARDRDQVTNDSLATRIDRVIARTWPLQQGLSDIAFSSDKSRMLFMSGQRVFLYNSYDNESMMVFKHDDDVLGAQFSRDESRVLTWSLDKTARLWDVTKSEPVMIFKHDDIVSYAQFSRDESRVLTLCDDARLWDVTKSEPVMIFKHDGLVHGAQFSRDASRVLSWSVDKTARLWDVTKAEPVMIFKHDSLVRGAQFSPDESRVLTWSEGKTASLWDVTKSEPVMVFKHDDNVTGAQFSRDASRVLTRSWDNTARLWDVTKSEPVMIFKHDGLVRDAQFSRDESRVLTWSVDDTARLWDVTKSEPVMVFKHESHVKGAQFSRDESRVLTWSEDKTASLWDVTKSEPVMIFKHDSLVSGAQFSPDESRVLTLGGNTARLWDVTKSEPVMIFKYDSYISGVQFSRDALRVLTWSAKTACLWDATKSEPVMIFKHDSYMLGAQFSPDESRVLTWSVDNTARLWDVTKSEPVMIFKHDGLILGAQFSRDASRVLTWINGKTASLWDVTKSEPVMVFKHDDNVTGAQFSRDASRVLTRSWDNTARLWDVTKSEPVMVFKHDGDVRGAQFSRDASRVLTWSSDSTARLWDVTKSEPVMIFKHDSLVSGAQFSPDESRVLTWSLDKTARLWDVTKSEPVMIFKHDDIVSYAQFSRDASRVLTLCDDARLWDVTKSEPVMIFKQDGLVHGAQFSPDESRVLTLRANTASLWDVTKSEPVIVFKHDNYVLGAEFSRDASRVLTWDDKTARLWDVTDSLGFLTPTERVLELEVRSATTLDGNLELRPLNEVEWRKKASSKEYKAIEEKILSHERQMSQASKTTQ